MNYFKKMRKILLLLTVSLFVQSCEKVCIKSDDFGEQSNTDLFKISARDLSICTFNYDSSDSSYTSMTDGILKRCMDGYLYNEDTGKYNENRTESVYSLIEGQFFDLENASSIFSNFKEVLETKSTEFELFKGYFCKDFDFLGSDNSNFITSFKDKSDIISSGQTPASIISTQSDVLMTTSAYRCWVVTGFSRITTSYGGRQSKMT